MTELNPFKFHGRLTKIQWKRQVPAFAFFFFPAPVLKLMLRNSDTVSETRSSWLIVIAVVLAAATYVWAVTTRRFRDAGIENPQRKALIGLAIPIFGWGWMIWKALTAPSVIPTRGNTGWQRPDPIVTEQEKLRLRAAKAAPPVSGPDPTRIWSRALEQTDRLLGAKDGPDTPLEPTKSWAEQVVIPPYNPDSESQS